MPATGSVLYRGLATVIVGGMCVSTIFTLLLLPSLLRVGERDPVAGSEAPHPARQPELEPAARRTLAGQDALLITERLQAWTDAAIAAVTSTS